MVKNGFRYRLARLACILALFAMVPEGVAAAQTFKLRFGAEWGTTEKFYEGHHYSFLTEDFMRVDDTITRVEFGTNAFILGNVGVSIADFLTFSLCSGYMGVSKTRSLVPLTGKFTITPKGCYSDGILAYLDAGFGFYNIAEIPDLLARMGAGYRYMLGNRLSLDFQGGIQMTVDHPELWDGVQQEFVPENRIRANDAVYLALTLSAVLSF